MLPRDRAEKSLLARDLLVLMVLEMSLFALVQEAFLDLPVVVSMSLEVLAWALLEVQYTCRLAMVWKEATST
jgi:hypothetical protein